MQKYFMIKAPVSMEPIHLQHFKTKCIFLNLLSSVNNESECLPVLGAFGFHKRLRLITATHSNFSSHVLLPRTYLFLIIMCGIMTSILLFSYTTFGFLHVVDLSHYVPCVDDLSYQQDCYFTEGMSAALGHCVMQMKQV